MRVFGAFRTVGDPQHLEENCHMRTGMYWDEASAQDRHSEFYLSPHGGERRGDYTLLHYVVLETVLFFRM